MANATILDQPVAANLGGTEDVWIVQGGTDRRTTTGDVARLAAPFSGNPLAVSMGGTGDTTLTAHGVMLGNGTSPVALATIGTAGRTFIDQGAGSDPAFESVSGDATLAANGALTIANGAITYAKIAAAAQGLNFSRLPKSANYTVANADKGDTVALGGNAFFTLTISAAASYDANFAVTLANEDVYTGASSGRGKAIISSASDFVSFILYPGQSCVVFNSNGVMRVSNPFARWRTPYNATVQVYVDPTLGSDPNYTFGGAIASDGLSTGAGAFASLRGAMLSTIFNWYDVRSGQGAQTIDVQVNLLGDHTATLPVHWVGSPLGVSGLACITVDLGGHTYTQTGASSDAFSIELGATLTIQNGKIAVTTANYGINATRGGTAIGANLTFGACGGGYIHADYGGDIELQGAIVFNGNSPSFANVDLGGRLRVLSGTTVTAGADVTFSTAFLDVDAGTADFSGAVLSAGGHTVTGIRIIERNGAQVHTGTGIGNLTYFLGTVAASIVNSYYDHIIISQAVGAESNPQATFVVSNNSATAIPVQTGAIASFVAADTISTLFGLDSYGTGSQSQLHVRAARGTAAAPANLVAGDIIGGMLSRAYVGGFSALSNAKMQFVYTDTSPNFGTACDFETTPNGSATRTRAMRIASGVIVGSGTTDPGTGNLSGPGFLRAMDATAIPAGGTQDAGVMVSSTAHFGIFFGSGAPTLSAAKGSLYLRSDGTTTNDRAYINTNGSTTWTALTTAA